MYKVEVKNSCRCFLRNGMVEVQEFVTKEEAKEEAQLMLKKMHETFCKKHSFVMGERFGDYTITITDDKR